jgi:hypothetical protein
MRVGIYESRRRALIAAGDPDSLAAAALVNGTFLMPGAFETRQLAQGAARPNRPASAVACNSG